MQHKSTYVVKLTFPSSRKHYYC